jgi:hypothetical protein
MALWMIRWNHPAVVASTRSSAHGRLLMAGKTKRFRAKARTERLGVIPLTIHVPPTGQLSGRNPLGFRRTSLWVQPWWDARIRSCSRRSR